MYGYSTGMLHVELAQVWLSYPRRERACASLLLSFLLLCCGLHPEPSARALTQRWKLRRQKLQQRRRQRHHMRRQHRSGPSLPLGVRRIRRSHRSLNAATAAQWTLSAAAGAAAMANNSGPQTVESGSCSVLAELEEKEAAEDPAAPAAREPALRNGKIKCAVLEEMKYRRPQRAAAVIELSVVVLIVVMLAAAAAAGQDAAAVAKMAAPARRRAVSLAELARRRWAENSRRGSRGGGGGGRRRRSPSTAALPSAARVAAEDVGSASRSRSRSRRRSYGRSPRRDKAAAAVEV